MHVPSIGINSGDPGDAPRVLWITRNGPGARPAGADTYSFGLLGALADAGASTTFVGLHPAEGPEPEGQLQRWCRAVEWRMARAPERGTVGALASSLPLVAARASPPEVVDTLRAVLGGPRFDAVVFDNYVSGWALDLVRHTARGRPPLGVYVAHNDETKLAADIEAAFKGDPFRKAALRLNAGKIGRLETRLLCGTDLLVTLTEHDRDKLLPRNPALATLVLPPGYISHRRPSRRITADVPRRVAMLGSIRWIAKRMNVAAFLQAADRRLAEAGITLDLIGDVPDDFRTEWEPRLAATRFRGFVDDLPREMDQVRLGLVVEATGGGFKLKTLDYLFNRVPVAALAVSCEGLPKAVVDTFLLADDVTGLTDRIIGAIDDLTDLNSRQEAAFAAANETFDWPQNGRRLLNAIASLRNGGSHGEPPRASARLAPGAR